MRLRLRPLYSLGGPSDQLPFPYAESIAFNFSHYKRSRQQAHFDGGRAAVPGGLSEQALASTRTNWSDHFFGKAADLIDLRDVAKT